MKQEPANSEPAPASSESQPPVPTEVDPVAPQSEVIWPPPPVVDRWAHRRGEPRLFALLWIGWLMLASAVALARVGPTGVLDPAVSRPVTRVLLFTIVLGGTILWPMLRLSQAMPTGRIAKHVLMDILIIYSTSQVVIWPQFFLAFWPVRVLQAVALEFLAWLLIVGGVLIWSMHIAQRSVGRSRFGLALLCLLVAAGGVVVPALSGWTPSGERPDPDLRMLASGLTAVFEITRDRFWTGSSARLAAAHWEVIRWTLLAGGLSIAAGALIGRAGPVANSQKPA